MAPLGKNKRPTREGATAKPKPAPKTQRAKAAAGDPADGSWTFAPAHYPTYPTFRTALTARLSQAPFSPAPRILPASAPASEETGSVSYIDGGPAKFDLLSILQAHRMLVAAGRARELEKALSELVGADEFKVEVHPYVANLIADHVSAADLAGTARTMSAAWRNPRGFVAVDGGGAVVHPQKPPDWIIPDPKDD